jgi:hypothetical protein
MIMSFVPPAIQTRTPLRSGNSSGMNGTMARNKIAEGRTPGRRSRILAAMFAPFEYPTATRFRASKW